MAKKIYVGNLPYTTDDDSLSEMFSQHGSVSSASVIKDRYTGQSRGFGFVEMPDDSEAAAAIEALNGLQMDGRSLVVNEARPREPRRGGGGGGGRGRGDFGGGGGGRRDRGGYDRG